MQRNRGADAGADPLRTPAGGDAGPGAPRRLFTVAEARCKKPGTHAFAGRLVLAAKCTTDLDWFLSWWLLLAALFWPNAPGWSRLDLVSSVAEAGCKKPGTHTFAGRLCFGHQMH